MKFYLLMTIPIILLISCNSNKIIYKDYQIGDYISNEFISKVELKDTLFYDLIPTTSEFYRGFNFYKNGIKFDCTINDSNMVYQISTNDRKFKTPENFGIGDSVKKVYPFLKNIYVLAGYGVFGTLKSGWNVAMDDGTFKSDTINDNFKILFFFIDEKSKMKIDYNLYKKR